MPIMEVLAKTVLLKAKRVDSWFVHSYGMNLYRGCRHNCAYCDGRAEGYYVEGEYGEDIAVKVNAVEILRRELDPRRKRVPFRRAFIVMGGGVGDSYQPVEEKYRLTRRVLELLLERNWPVHMLTKSTLALRDIDLYKSINERARAVVSFSFSTVDDEVSRVFEPGVPRPGARLDAIKRLKEAGIACGFLLMPVVPLVSDSAEAIEAAVAKATEAGADFVLCSGMTLKDGRQKDHFVNTLRAFDPRLVAEYDQLYRGDRWGNAVGDYHQRISRRFAEAARRHQVPVRMPGKLFQDLLSPNDLASVLLDQIDYMLKLAGQKTSFGFAAYNVSRLEEPLSSIKDLGTIKGVTPPVAKVLREIIERRTAVLYEQLLRGATVADYPG